MAKITKAVIPCAGMGTRFMPITKSVPKELMTIIDTPVLSYIVDEAKQSGVKDVLIVISPQKEGIKNYFTQDKILEEKLLSAGKQDVVDILNNITKGINFTFVYQNEPKGSGDAVYKAKEFVGNDPFYLAWGDDLIVNSYPVMAQLGDAYEKCGNNIVGVQSMFTDDIVKYGVGDVIKSEGKLHYLKNIVEKPPLNEIPSRLASLGRYALSPEIFDYIEKTPVGKNNEYQFTDALALMSKDGKVCAYEFDGKRYDMGDKFGAMQAYTEFALNSAEFGKKYREYIKNLAEKL
jgi:UTP--glucose-1-phosphate uridylyltransferase